MTARSAQEPQTKQTVLLLGNYRPTITLARELSSRGYVVMAGLAGCDRGIEHSRYASRIWDHPSLIDEPERFQEELIAFIETYNVDVVYPVLEEYVAFFAQKSLERISRAVVASVSPDVVRKSLDKAYMMTLARQLNIPTAQFAKVTNFRQLKEQSARIGYPLVVRPASSNNRLGDSKAVFVENQDQMAASFPDWPRGHAGLILQKKVLGHRFNVYFTALNGNLVRSLYTEILETDKMDGTGLAVEGQAVPSMPLLQRYTADFLKSLNYSGVGCAQYIVSEDSVRTSFLEINPRIVGSHAVAEYAGLEMSEFPIKVSLGREIDTTAFFEKTGFHYVWTIGALQAAKAEWTSGQIGTRETFARLLRICLAFVRSRSHMVFSTNDPMPAIMALKGLLPSKQRLLRLVRNEKRQPAQEPREPLLTDVDAPSPSSRNSTGMGTK